MVPKIRISFFPESESRFVRTDLDLLKKYFIVKTQDFIFSKIKKKKSIVCLFKLIKNVYWSDITFSWFASTHAFFSVFFAKLFRKKSIVIVGGYEVAKEAAFNYGLLLSPISSFEVKYVLKNADLIIAVSSFCKQEIIRFTKNTKIRLLYNAVPEVDVCSETEKKENLVITVAYNEPNIELKGLRTFIDASKQIPGLKFMVIGLSNKLIAQLAPESPGNLAFVPTIDYPQLVKYYKKAKVYCQLSYRESFGMALAEAMSYGCVPVVTPRGALPEIVGDAGFYVPYGDIKGTVGAIKKAIISDRGKIARDRTQRLFSSKRRDKELVNIVNSIVKKLS